MKNFAAVIFDLDGLLLDSERLILETFQATCQELSIPDLSDLFKRCIGANMQVGQAILKAGMEGIIDFEHFNKSWKSRYALILNGDPIPEKQGASDLLNHISSLGLPMVVATSSQTERALLKLEKSNLLHHFKDVVGGDQVERSKPNPDIFLQAANKAGMPATECLAFEDSDNGVRAAVAAGMTVIQVPDLVQPSPELLELGHIVLPSLMDSVDYNFLHKWLL